MLKAIKRSSMLLGVFLAFGVSYGMGETTPMQSVPTGITCKVIDNTGKSHILQNCNCDGRTYIDVKDGSLSYFVDLNTVRSIDVEAFRANNVEVDLKTNANPNGKLVELSKDMICYGLGSLGNAKFYIKNIKSIYILKP
ncbi:MAG: hypothetical protein ACP5S8_04245 [Hydrogenobaculum sp.]